MTPRLVETAEEVLAQGAALLCQMDKETYSRVLRRPFNTSIGRHYGHVLEHFQSLLCRVRSAEVDYDAHEPNPRLEREPAYALAAICDLMSTVKDWDDTALRLPCKVMSSSCSQARESRIDSNIGRELSYCIAYAIDHYGIIRLICAEVGIPVPDQFGLAPSTVKNMSSLVAN
jgi:hypothetical protein